MQSIIFHGVYSSLENATSATGAKPFDQQDWNKLHSFKANGKKWHVYETELNEKVQMD